MPPVRGARVRHTAQAQRCGRRSGEQGGQWRRKRPPDGDVVVRTARSADALFARGPAADGNLRSARLQRDRLQKAGQRWRRHRGCRGCGHISVRFNRPWERCRGRIREWSQSIQAPAHSFVLRGLRLNAWKPTSARSSSNGETTQGHHYRPPYVRLHRHKKVTLRFFHHLGGMPKGR